MYKVQQYEKYLPEFTESMLHRYNLLKSFSNNFKEESVAARELDRLLSEQLEQKFKGRASSSNPKVSTKRNNGSKTDEAAAYAAMRKYLEPLVGQDYSIRDIQDIAKDSTPEITFNIRGDKIHVTKLAGRKVKYNFGLRAFYVQLRDALGIAPASLPELDKISKQETTAKKKPVPQKKQTDAAAESEILPDKQEKTPEMVERLSEEVRFIKRYALLDGKVKTPEQMRAFTNAVRKAILEKRIRKFSPYAEQIIYIQDRLVNWCNSVKTPETVAVNPEVLQEFRNIASTEQLLLSGTYLKRYMNIQGKELDKEKAGRLHDLIKKAIQQDKITKSDPYRQRLENALKSLHRFVKSAKATDTLKMHPTALNGIKTALEGCPCEEEDLGYMGKKAGAHAGVTPHVPQIVISSVDFENFQIQTLGLFGRWYNFIGDASRGFNAMIFGKPKLGKTYLAIDFAGYLAHFFGPVLYVTREEGFSGTFQQKIIEQGVAHPELYIASEIPEDFAPYDFVFFDSATRLNFVPGDIGHYKRLYPGKTFVYVFQATKDGNFRGSQEFEHDVDVVIEVYDLGKARQYGRFNQGSEMNIFDNDETIDFQQAA
ncbi:MAG TPA: hypothetical protein VD905_19715 [Flavobacteriales bacterium]|nr:hypothetical protein [Flavobacteriales bacterium]